MVLTHALSHFNLGRPVSNPKAMAATFCFIVSIFSYQHAAEAASGFELYNLCNGYERFEKYQEALEACTEALKQPWYESLIRFERAYIYMKLNMFQDAIGDFDRAIELGMGDSAYFGRGLAWEKLGEKERARDDFAKVAKTSGEWAQARPKLLEYGLLGGPCKFWGALCW
jgi:tetratricopeptide (TPR) repeat protein